jgi:hypothetical protein
MATGWLVRDDVLVTAGHCAFDWSSKDAEGLGRALEVKAYIGHRGKASVNDGTVQFRHGVKAVTTEGWLQSGVKSQQRCCIYPTRSPFR